MLKKLFISCLILVLCFSAFATDEIVFRRVSGASYYVTIRDMEDGYKIWFPSAFETWGTSAHDLTDYAIAAVETFGNSLYTVDMPAGINSAQRLLIEIYDQAGGSPTVGDTYTGGYVLVWNGTTEEFIIDTDGEVVVGTNNDKTGYSLAADQPVNVTKWGGSATLVGNITEAFDDDGVVGKSFAVGQIIIDNSGDNDGHAMRITPGASYIALRIEDGSGDVSIHLTGDMEIDRDFIIGDDFDVLGNFDVNSTAFDQVIWGSGTRELTALTDAQVANDIKVDVNSILTVQLLSDWVLCDIKALDGNTIQQQGGKMKAVPGSL